MYQTCKELIAKAIGSTPIQYLPVRVRKGLAKGARWTLFPSSSYWRGNTELDVETAIRLHGNLKGATCWDLGAHFGIYTIGLAMAVGPTGEVVGFEPDPFSYKRCKRHVAMNSLGWVKLFNVAASNVRGTGTLIRNHGPGASTSHFAYADDEDPGTRTLKVPTIVLDSLVEERMIRPAKFIKIDVEGHGAQAIQGARKTIETHRPTLVMSFHSEWELTGTRKILEPLGYRSYNSEGGVLSWQDSIFRTTVLRC